MHSIYLPGGRHRGLTLNVNYCLWNGVKCNVARTLCASERWATQTSSEGLYFQQWPRLNRSQVAEIGRREPVLHQTGGRNGAVGSCLQSWWRTSLPRTSADQESKVLIFWGEAFLSMASWIYTVAFLFSHRIVEYLELEGTRKDYWVPLPILGH